MTDDQSPKKQGRRIGCGCLALIAAAILLLALPTTFAIWSIRASDRVNEELARIEAAGEPVTPEDLAAMYDNSPADPDVAKAWLAASGPFEEEAFRTAAEELPLVGDYEKEIPPPGQPWEDLEAVEELLEQYEASLQQLHEAAELDAPARYSIDFRRGFFAGLAHIAPLRQAASLLALQAHTHAHRGDAHGTARAIHVIFKVGVSIEQEPTLVSQIGGMVSHSKAIELLRQLLPHVEFADEDRELLQADLRAPDFKKAIRLGFLGERVMGLQAFYEHVGPLAPLLRDDLRFYLRHMDHILAAVKKPWPQARKEVADTLRHFDNNFDSTMADLRYPFSRMMVPASDAALEAAARTQARSRMADAAIAVQQFFRKHGKLPETLDQLVPAFLPKVPSDPYDGKPLRYVIRQGEYVVYSIGKNDIDDGGQGDEDGDPDHVFAVTIEGQEAAD